MISMKLQIELNNLFIFAKSFPIMDADQYSLVVQK